MIACGGTDDRMSTTTYIRVDNKLIVIPGIVQIALQQNHILNEVYL